jgi:hypothetical protein
LAANGYRPGDIIYLAKDAGGKIALVPVLLVTLLSVSLDGELWKVRRPDTGDLYDHFIQYADDDDPGREAAMNAIQA